MPPPCSAPTPALPYDPNKALRRLRRADPGLAAVISRVGPFSMRIGTLGNPFRALLRSIVYQQLSGHAAGRIHARVLDLFPRRRAGPRRLLELSDAALRGAGLSGAKVAAARDLAAKVLDRTVPTQARLQRMEDAEIVERLVSVRGIGRWTVEMMLMSQLGRPDVLPATDLGIRKGFMRIQGADELPSPGAVLEHGERWRPYRTVASWYLWRATELDW